MVQPAEQAVPLVQEGSPQEADAEGQKTAEKPEIQEEVGGETPTEIQGETGETGETGENGQSPAEPPRSSVEAAFGQEVREQEVREQEISEQENAKDSPATNHSPETEQTSQVVAFPTGQQVDAQPPAPDSTEQQDQPATISTPAPAPALTKVAHPDALRGIREASQELGVEPHVLRFWETRFSALRPIKHAGGRRLYRPQDMELLRRIYALLREDGMTIKGAAKVIGNRAGRAEAKNDKLRRRANDILKVADELEALFK